MSDPYQFFTADQIAAASACPIANVREHWPRLVEQLEHCGINDRATQIAMIGTTAIESASQFAPVREAFFLGEPEPAESYRKRLAYYPFYGRGEIQLTHESGYRTYGKMVDELWAAGGAIDLVTRPDDALNPDVAAAVAACYFKANGIADAARAGDWAAVRRKVYGGDDPKGAARIAQIAADLGRGNAALTYNPSQPPERQIQSWVCSIRATAWALKSLGLPVDIGALQGEMSPKYVTEAQGLLDRRGYGVADVVKAHLPADWSDRVHVFETITWDELVSLAGKGPIALGLHGAYHWLNVAGARVDGSLDSPNPAPNYPQTGPIGDTLTRAELDRYGPASAVWINAAAQPVPADPPPPADSIHQADFDAIISQLQALRSRAPAA